jgi:hypothetical protein
MDIDPLNLTQAQLADIVGVDRTTIRAWQKHGMPHTPPTSKGKAASYCGPLALNWWGGHRAADKWSLKLSVLEKIALGLSLGTEDGPNTEERARFLETAAQHGYTREDTLAALGTARGIMLARRKRH